MKERVELDLWEWTAEILRRMEDGGVLCTVVDNAGKQNLLTLGWGFIGRSYHGHPVFTIAVTPLRYSWRFLEEVADFVISVPTDSHQEAAAKFRHDRQVAETFFPESICTLIRSIFTLCFLAHFGQTTITTIPPFSIP